MLTLARRLGAAMARPDRGAAGLRGILGLVIGLAIGMAAAVAAVLAFAAVVGVAGDAGGPRPAATRGGERAEPSRGHLVTRVVDGDTLELGNGETVRIVGIDTPEVGECGFERSSARLAELVEGRTVALGGSGEDRDQYDRLLRYVDIGALDAGLSLIREGLAVARYDSRDGYGRHPREDVYVAADRRSPDVRCAPGPRSLAEPGGGCEPGYTPCVPPHPPDVDCADVSGPIRVTGSDPHGLDGEGDGRACE